MYNLFFCWTTTILQINVKIEALQQLENFAGDLFQICMQFN